MLATHAPTILETRTEAMGSKVHVIVTGPTDLGRALNDALGVIGRLEATWSRFAPTSEISQLNRQAGQPVAVSRDTLELVSRATEAWRRTDRLFDPTLLRSLEAAGYDQTFATLNFSDVPGSGPVPGPGCEGIIIDRFASTITLPGHVAFDPGGLGKGMAADLVVDRLRHNGVEGALVNIGGDLACFGTGPTGSGWTVAAGDTTIGLNPVVIDLAVGGVATSTCRRRRWTTPTGDAHHLIDPETGRPATGAADSVTVIAGSACDAETLATALAVLGDIPGDLAMIGGAAVIVQVDGRCATAGPVESFVR